MTRDVLDLSFIKSLNRNRGIMKKLIAWLKERAKLLKSETDALFLAFKRKDTPLLAKIIVGVTVCYALSPIDLIPDFIPVLGFLDDVLLLPLLIALAIKLIPKNILDECREEAALHAQEKTSKRFIYALPVIIIWLIIIGLVVKAIIN
jgi:uncharacterized membrane protein YkvA (DUF1232 family)